MKCPVCENPIEPRTVVACKRCFALFPGRDRQRIREIYVRSKKDDRDPLRSLRGKIEKLVRLTRERHPETRPVAAVIAVDHAVAPDQTVTALFADGVSIRVIQ